jgi:hypothetical protein
MSEALHEQVATKGAVTVEVWISVAVTSTVEVDVTVEVRSIVLVDVSVNVI